MTTGVNGWFVTGTDTEVGKTRVSVGLLTALAGRGLATVTMKPVASGCAPGPDGLRNEDALLLDAAASLERPYELINPYAFEPAIAPHIAAREAGVRIDLGYIRECFARVVSGADVVVVEGVGGWQVPLGPGESTADLAVALALPVVLVVGMRLGCLNHALLSAESIRGRGLMLGGWVANCLDPDAQRLEENIQALQERLGAPFLGAIPYLAVPDAGAVADALRLEKLLSG